MFHLQIHTCIEDALKYLDPQIMPKEYGGVMPMAEMIGKVRSQGYSALPPDFRMRIKD
jgi:hypothetical protein